MNRKQHFRTHVQGESLENQINLLYDKITEILLLPIVIFVATIFICMIYIGVLKVELLTVVFLLILLVVFSIRAFFKIKKLHRQIWHYRKGLDGERYVGSMLEKFSSNKTFVFHDIVCEKQNNGKIVKFNIDHVVISTKGIFTIDSKNWSLPDREYNQADFVFKDGELIDSTGILQKDLMDKIDSQGKWLEDKIYEWINQRIPVYRVGIMIGAYVNNVNKDFSKFWIVNESAFAGLFDREKEKMPMQDVLRISDSIRRFVEKPIK